MAQIEQVKLSEFFRSVRRPRYLLGTTYTLSLAFFESVVYPCIDRPKLKYCLVISDTHGYHRALEEGAALQGAAQGYMVVPAPAHRCLHAKVWLLIGESDAALLVGSGNLTQSGFMTNVELFDSLFFSEESPPTGEQVTQITAFLAGLISMWAEEDRPNLLCVEMLAEILREFRALWRVSSSAISEAPRFVHSFSGPIVDQLPEPAGKAKLYVAAPYFGNSTDGLKILNDRMRPRATQVFPAVHEGDLTDFPLKEVSEQKDVKVARLGMPGKKGFAHLKLYGAAEDDGKAWLLCTSANCTQAALSGRNIEAGLLRRTDSKSLASYFTVDKKALPNGTLQYSAEYDKNDRIYLWACDSGMGVDITASQSCVSRLPLTQVCLTVRVGSSISAIELPTMFAERRTEHVSWAAFDDLYRARNMAVCIQIKGLDPNGKVVVGACFAENRMLLTADPLHRSAWRGALALLDTESMPDLSDIAAIFTLVSNIFDGRLVSRSNISGDLKVKRDGKEDQEVTHIPIWPPQADTSDLHRRIGTTGLGQLALCQKILQTLLKPQTQPAAKRLTQPSLDETEGDSAEDAKDTADSQAAREEIERRAKKLAQRLWERAEGDYRGLHKRLLTLCPEEEVAPNVWPAAIFVFLATTAVHRATARVLPSLSEKTAMRDLIDQFITLMLNERKQPEDFCCPQDFRYRNDDRFPPLADDLRTTFNVQPDVDLATVVVSALIARKMRIAPNGEYAVLWQRQLQKVVGSNFQPTADFRDACRRIWSQYLQDDVISKSEVDFDAAYTDIWQAFSGART